MAKRKTTEQSKQDKTNSSKPTDHQPLNDRIAIFLSLFFAVIILARGVYLFFAGSYDSGLTLAGRYGQGGGNPTGISAYGYIFIGLFLIFLAVILVVTGPGKRKK